MLVGVEIPREDLEVEDPELLLTACGSEQRVEPILVVSGSIGGNDRVGAEHCIEPVTDLFHRFTLTLQKF